MIKVSQQVYDGLEACRSSGAYNMFDYKSVAKWCLNNGYDDTYHWMLAHKSEYVEGIFAGFEVE